MTWYPEPDEYRSYLSRLGFTIERETEDRRASYWSFNVTFEGLAYRVLWSGSNGCFYAMLWDGELPEPLFNASTPAAGPEGSEAFKALLRSLVADPTAFAAAHAPVPFVEAPPAKAAVPGRPPVSRNTLRGLIAGAILIVLWLVLRSL